LNPSTDYPSHFALHPNAEIASSYVVVVVVVVVAAAVDAEALFVDAYYVVVVVDDDKSESVPVNFDHFRNMIEEER
jgi:hypothetical protein